MFTYQQKTFKSSIRTAKLWQIAADCDRCDKKSEWDEKFIVINNAFVHYSNVTLFYVNANILVYCNAVICNVTS